MANLHINVRSTSVADTCYTLLTNIFPRTPLVTPGSAPTLVAFPEDWEHNSAALWLCGVSTFLHVAPSESIN